MIEFFHHHLVADGVTVTEKHKFENLFLKLPGTGYVVYPAHCQINEKSIFKHS